MLLEDHPLVIFMYSILHAFAKQTNNKSITNNTPCKLIFFSMIYYFSCVTRSFWFATQHWFAYHAGCVLWMIFDQNDHIMSIGSVQHCDPVYRQQCVDGGIIIIICKTNGIVLTVRARLRMIAPKLSKYTIHSFPNRSRFVSFLLLNY